VLHRVAAMASGGMDTLPHNGAVITVLAVTGLTHRQAYKDIFVITLTKSAAGFFVIGVYYLTGFFHLWLSNVSLEYQSERPFDLERGQTADGG
jgi:hypothetical protein